MNLDICSTYNLIFYSLNDFSDWIKYFPKDIILKRILVKLGQTKIRIHEKVNDPLDFVDIKFLNIFKCEDLCISSISISFSKIFVDQAP